MNILKLYQIFCRLQNEVEMLQERLCGLQNENTRLTGELINTSTRYCKSVFCEGTFKDLPIWKKKMLST